MRPRWETDTPHLPFDDPTQQRYEIIRPIVVTGTRTIAERAHETGMHPETVGRFTRDFAQQGMRGLLPDTVQVVPAGRQGRVKEAVLEELAALKSLYDGFQYRELCWILYGKLEERISDKTVKKLWHRLPPASPRPVPLLDYHRYAERTEARQQVIELYCQGWNKLSISRVMRVSRPTINEWIRRFERDNLASLADHSRAPKHPSRTVWLPVMLEVYHLQKRHPDAGGFRMWSLRGQAEPAVRTIERIMALNRQVYPDIPHGATHREPKAPQPHPFKATYAHEYWFIDGRMMDFAIDGVRWWSLIVLDGYSRTMLAGAVAPSEASWIALTVLFTACQRYGAPHHLISDKGGAYISTVFEAVCGRLGIDHTTITGKDGESYKNLMETHFNIQRRLYDYQFSFSRTPVEFAEAHQRFLDLYNSTAHHGLLHEHFVPPIPLQVLGEAKGRCYTIEDLERTFACALFPRTTNRYGCVTLHRSHFYVEEGLPQTKVWLWVSGHELRAVFEHVVLAEYHCHYDVRARHVTDIRDGRYYRHDAYASKQGALIAFNPHDAVVVYHPTSAPRQLRLPFAAQQLWLFEWVS